jgi:GDPmannose 4,6-dehydratase
MFGDNPEHPQSEETRLMPASPYACAKVFAHGLTRNYREGYGIHASSGILFNHESPRRGETFVTRKITLAAARIRLGLQDTISLGNLDAKRDWGFAKDYVEAMWLMLQQEKPLDLVIGTGETHSVREFVEESFKNLPLPKQIRWVGHGLDEVGMIDDKVVVRIDAKYFRNAEVENLLADPKKSEEVLKWNPKTKFHDLVKIMIQHDLYTQRHIY